GGVLGAFRQVAVAAGVAGGAEEVIGGLAGRIDAVAARSAAVARRPRVALLEWLAPPFSCGHWSPELVRLAGGIEGFGREGEPSRTLSWDEGIAGRPEVIVAACCGLGVERTPVRLAAPASVPGWPGIPAVSSGRVYAVDGSHYFSRPGPRLVDSLEILAHALPPEAHPLPAGLPLPACVGGRPSAVA